MTGDAGKVVVEVNMPSGLTPEEEENAKKVAEAISISFDLPPGGEVIARFPRSRTNLDDTNVFIRIKRR